MSKRINYLLLLTTLLFSPLLHAEILPAHVVGVIDGDTVKVKDQNGIKYIVSLTGVDAPEIMQAHGRIAKEQLCKMICGKDVLLSYNKLNTDGHVLSTMYLDQANINQVILEKGMAWQNTIDKKSVSRQHYSKYARAENKARVQNIGLWQDGIAMSPWRWRQISQGTVWE